MKYSWLEKYRPTSLSEIVGQQHIIPRLIKLVERCKTEKDYVPPDIGLFGPPGCGKTAIVGSLIAELGEGEYKNTKILNASDDRGIDVVRNEIKRFAKLPPMDGAKFSIVFLDESDSMTPDAQGALRRTMEKYKQTVFILTGNYLHEIIEPLQSRMMITASSIVCSRISPEDLLILINRVVEGEMLDVDEDVKPWIANRANGDARKAILTLYMLNLKDGKITMDDTKDMKSFDEVSVDFVMDLAVVIALPEPDSGNIDTIMNGIDTLYYDMGLSGEQILYGIFEKSYEIREFLGEDYNKLLANLADGMDIVGRANNDLIVLKAFLGKLCVGDV